MSEFKPTDEQCEALDLATAGKTFKISAYAGSGKTSTLKLVGDKLSHKRGLYLAFNKSIASEAQRKFKKNITCKTFHSLAYQASPKYITEKIKNPRMMPTDISKMFSVKQAPLPLAKSHGSELCTYWDIGLIIENCINNFCITAEKKINIGHVLSSMPSWADPAGCTDFASKMLQPCQDFWEMCVDPNKQIRISHSVYLKHWALNDPIIQEDFCLFDEAQDADPIMLDVLRKQDKQVIWVGDRHQSIYGFRGAENAMQALHIPEVKLTKSFRFGEAVAETANLIFRTLLDENVPLVGNERIDSTVGMVDQPDAFLVRTNSGALTLAIQLAEDGRKPQVEIDIDELNRLMWDVQKIKNNEPVDKDSAYFGFNSWKEVINYVEENKSCDIGPFSKLIENNGVGRIRSVISKLSKADGDCVISTAHKSKGLEFQNVLLHDDFEWDKDGLNDGPLVELDESRLIYVAATRAIQNLDLGGMHPLFDKLDVMDRRGKKVSR